MAEHRQDRLSRDEALLMQQKAMREWHESSWLAEHDPMAWRKLDAMHPDAVHVDLGAGIGESEQEPGYIALDRRTMDRRELRERTGEMRLPDITWDIVEGLPFEDQSVDRYCARGLLRELSPVALGTLPAELARTLCVGGTVALTDDQALVRRVGGALEDKGFALKDMGRPVPASSPTEVTTTYELTSQNRPMADVAPPLVDERNMGTLTIREPRRPTPA